MTTKIAPELVGKVGPTAYADDLSLTMADLGAKHMTSSEFEKGNPQFDASQQMQAMQQQAEALRNAAANVVGKHLGNLSGVGVGGIVAGKVADGSRSLSDRLMNGMKDDGVPTGPGFAYAAHLFRKIAKHKKDGKENKSKKSHDIYTDQIEALKTALQACGVYSEKNPGGLPIDIKEAKKAWFGEKEVDNIEEAEWRSLIEMGDTRMDSKRVRKFVNYDGSLTWELLNEDKTVMSRFTMGEYAGMKIFTQGGYSKFAELLKKVQEQKGPDHKGVFDSIRGQFSGM